MRISDDQLTPCEFMKGFFKVKGKDYSVSEIGEAFSYYTKKVYSSSTVDVDFEKRYASAYREHIHVLMAEAFLQIPEGLSRSDVIPNHKDGDKSNNHIDNLEWTTRTGNLIHAYETGLRTENIRLKSKNIETGQVNEFLSIWDCARHFKVNGGRVHGYLYRKIREAAFLGTHLLVRLNENFPSDEESRNWKVADNRMSVVVFNANSETATIYQTATHAAEAIGIKRGTLAKRLRRSAELDRYYVECDGWVIVPIQHAQEYMKFVKTDLRSETWVRTYAPPSRRKTQQASQSEMTE